MALVRKKQPIEGYENKLEVVPIEQVIIKREGLRTSSDVEDLVNSIREVGLTNPLTVNSNYELLAGGRRYSAVKQLGWKKVQVQIVSFKKNSDLYEDLIHIDENLIRLDLTDMAAEDAIARRKKIYEELHPETKNGGDRKSDKIRSQKSGSDKPCSFIEDTAKKTGKSKSAVEDAVRRSEKASPKLRAAREAGKVTATKVTELIKLSEEDQDALAPFIKKDTTISQMKEIVKAVQKNGIESALTELKSIGAIAKIKDNLTKVESILSGTLQSIYQRNPKVKGAEEELTPIIDDIISLSNKILKCFDYPTVILPNPETQRLSDELKGLPNRGEEAEL